MARRLSAEERALWRKVVESVRPFAPFATNDEPEPMAAPTPRPSPPPRPSRRREETAPPTRTATQTLDGSWDRRLSRGLAAPDRVVDLHGHGLDGAYRLLDDGLEAAIESGARLMLLITGRPPSGDWDPVGRGAIRAAVGDWLAASRHAADIAAVRTAHSRHGGAGALYIVLRRRGPMRRG